MLVNDAPHDMTLDSGAADNGTYTWTGLIDAAGQFMLFAALVEPGTLTPFSDIGTAGFMLQ